MATNSVLVANPTPADITVNAQTAKAGKVTTLTITDTLTDLDNFVAQGCVVAPASLTNGTGNVNDVLDNSTSLVEKGASLLYRMIRAVQSAGADTHGQAGL